MSADARWTGFDAGMMRRALELAERGRYSNHPNPRVGCVVTQGERIVGEGWHRKWGEAHAEVRALDSAGDAARGATVYVTLEPHCFQGRTPPCTDALIRAGVRRVVCGALDPNPRVQGAGLKQLEAAGMQVEVGLLSDDVRELNLGFERRMTTGRPRVRVKIAASLDGRVALASGESRWITGEAARADVQRLRAESSAVLTGIDTVLADDPQLNVRDPAIELLGRQPLRVVLDTKLRMPHSARMLQADGEVLVFTAPERAGAGVQLEGAGAKVIASTLDEEGRNALPHVLEELGRRQCNDVLVEAGSTFELWVLQLGLADELIVYLAPVMLGPDARPMAVLAGLNRIEDAARYTLTDLCRVGDDVKLVFRPAGSQAV